MKTQIRSFAVAASLALAGALACSFSDSSESFSDSSKSSSNSSGGKDESAQFQQDVEQYTAVYVQAGGRGEESFLSGLGDLARKRGVSDWESEPETWEAIGRGLGRANLGDAERTAYAQAWTAGDADRADAVERGLEAKP